MSITVHSNSGKEQYAVYTGLSTPAFSPLIAGITFPNPDYIIHRSHADLYVFEYVWEGKGFVRQDEEEAEVCAGDAYILQAGHCHHYYPDRSDPWKKIWFNVRGSFVRHLLSDYELEHTLHIPGFGQPDYLYEIMQNIEQSPSGCLNQLSFCLHRYIQALSAFVGHPAVQHSPAVIMKNYIEQNLTRSLSLEEIAQSVHLSPSRALHLYKEEFQIPPYRYYLTQRFELAQSMLLNTDLSVQGIAGLMGFKDYHHFSIFFKKECGVSPSEYRMQRHGL